MAIKKVKFEADEEKIFDDAVIYRRGDTGSFASGSLKSTSKLAFL